MRTRNDRQQCWTAAAAPIPNPGIGIGETNGGEEESLTVLAVSDVAGDFDG